MVTRKELEAQEERSALIAELVSRAERAGEPGRISGKADVLEDGPEEYIRIGSVTSAGYVYIYDTLTGEQSITNRNMLPSQLRKVHDDGSLAFTTIKPSRPPRRGTVRCYLHPDRPERELYDEMHLPHCQKANLTSDYEAQSHMRARHKREWAAIQAIKEEAEKEEERQWRLLMRERWAQGTPPNEASIAMDTRAPARTASNTFHASCLECGKGFSGQSEKAVNNKVRLHQRSHKGGE